MAVTVANVITNLDTYFGDASVHRVSQAERFQAVTEATVWLLEELGNDHAIKTYTLNFLDTVNYYKVTTPLADLLASADLRREELDHDISALPKSAKDMAVDIGNESTIFAWAVDRQNNDSYLAITLEPKNKAKILATFDSIDTDGEWEADTTNSDATNVTLDSVEFKYGNGSLNFDVDVSQSGNNRATIFNDSLNTLDLSQWENTGSFVFEVYLPDVTNFSSITFYWGTDSSNYWSATVTTDINGTAWANGWNRVKVDWANATATASPDSDDIEYIRFDFNYTGSQTDDTDFRIDQLRIAKPERLTYHYVSWDVGTSNAGADLAAFTATTDIPFFSGKYDQYKYAVAHKAASILFYRVRLREEAMAEAQEAQRALDRQREVFPISKSNETSNFKVFGVSFGPKRRRMRFKYR